MASTDNVVTVQGDWVGPRPNIDFDMEPFWEGLAQHKFLLWRCEQCGAWYWPRAYCKNHPVGAFCEGMGWTEASGYGKVFAFNIHHWAFDPAFKDRVPYTYALVETDEGPLISSTLVGDLRPRSVYDIGGRVEIVYEDHPDAGFTLPRFRMI